MYILFDRISRKVKSFTSISPNRTRTETYLHVPDECLESFSNISTGDTVKNVSISRHTNPEVLLKEKYKYFLNTNPEFSGIIGEDFYDKDFPEVLHGNGYSMGWCHCRIKDFIVFEFEIPSTNKFKLIGQLNLENKIKTNNFTFQYADGDLWEVGVSGETIELLESTNKLKIQIDAEVFAFLEIDWIAILHEDNS